MEDFSYEDGVTLPQNSYKHRKRVTVKENHIGPAVSEILC